jgi:hypothetical protein
VIKGKAEYKRIFLFCKGTERLHNMKCGKKSFQQKFTEEMFLNARSIDSIKSTATIMSLVRCSRFTAKNIRYKLVTEGKVNKIKIEGNSYGWQKVKGD